MSHSLEKRMVEMREMIEMIPKMQEAVRMGLNNHFQELHEHDKEHVEKELHSLRKAINMIDSKYVLDIIFVLSRENESLFFNELKRILSYVNVGTLSKRLKSLERDGVIERKIHTSQSPVRISYNLTGMGYGIFRLLLPMLVYVTYYDNFRIKKD